MTFLVLFTVIKTIFGYFLKWPLDAETGALGGKKESQSLFSKLSLSVGRTLNILLSLNHALESSRKPTWTVG